MNTPKQSRRKGSAIKLEPIDWHEFANDAVLNGNMSTLYHRPPSEDPTAYASAEALVEIEKRVGRPGQSAVVIDFDLETSKGSLGPTVGSAPTEGDGTGTLKPGAKGVQSEPVVMAVGGMGTLSLEPDVCSAHVSKTPTVGMEPTVGEESTGKIRLVTEETTESNPAAPTVDPDATEPRAGVGPMPTVGGIPTVGKLKTAAEVSSGPIVPTVGIQPTVGSIYSTPEPIVSQTALFATAPPVVSKLRPTVGVAPTVGLEYVESGTAKRKVKPIRDVQDGLTLAGQVLYKAMYGAPDGAKSKTCTKGYRQLAAETHLDKDTVRDLISEFKSKGIVREIQTYDPDTRSAKTYDVLSYKAILQTWREAGLLFVTTGRQRPAFCTAQGEPLIFTPTVGLAPIAPKGTAAQSHNVTAGPMTTESAESSEPEALHIREVIQTLQHITGNPVDGEAADRLIKNCRAEAADCTIEEIVEFAWSKAFLCRSGKIENPIGFLITQVPKHFQGEALKAYRDKKRKELEVAATLAAREETRRRTSERELAQIEEEGRFRSQIAERHRKKQGIDLKSVLQDSDADEVLKEWARRLLKLGHRYEPRYE